MNGMNARRLAVLPLAAGAALVACTSASAHARVSPPLVVAKQSQVFTLAVPTEEANATMTTIVLTLPKGFSIDSFVPSPGWKRTVQQSGAGDNAVTRR